MRIHLVKSLDIIIPKLVIFYVPKMESKVLKTYYVQEHKNDNILQNKSDIDA